MSLLDRFLFKKKDESAIISKKKRFSIKQFYRKKQSFKVSEETKPVVENQELLTQCIETALGTKRWTVMDSTSLGFSDMQPPPTTQRQRKLSLPPQFSNIGYLASIPEADSFTEKQ